MRPRLLGRPAAGFEVGEVTRGAGARCASRVRAAACRRWRARSRSRCRSKARSRGVSDVVNMGLDDPLLRVLGSPRVRATVRIREVEGERALDGVPVEVRNGEASVRPAAVRVVVTGPASLLRTWWRRTCDRTSTSRAPRERPRSAAVAVEFTPGHAGLRVKQVSPASVTAARHPRRRARRAAAITMISPDGSILRDRRHPRPGRRSAARRRHRADASAARSCAPLGIPAPARAHRPGHARERSRHRAAPGGGPGRGGRPSGVGGDHPHSRHRPPRARALGRAPQGVSPGRGDLRVPQPVRGQRHQGLRRGRAQVQHRPRGQDGGDHRGAVRPAPARGPRRGAARPGAPLSRAPQALVPGTAPWRACTSWSTAPTARRPSWPGASSRSWARASPPSTISPTAATSTGSCGATHAGDAWPRA